MSVHLVTFSDESMSRSAQLCVKSGVDNGVTDHHWLTPEVVRDWPEVKAHPRIFRQPEDVRRAWSWWAFKPLVINRELSWLSDGSICIYADAGVEFINNLSHIIDRMDQDIFLFANNWEHAHWCKRDVIEEVWPLTMDEWQTGIATLNQDNRHGNYSRAITMLPFQRFGKQVQASVIFFRVSDYTRKFVKEWLDWCLFEGGRLIDDSPSRLPNHPEFREHRHDQAILTTMAYRDSLKLHYWPATYNDGAFNYEKLPEYAEDTYPTLFHHHRRRQADWENAA